jgi:two-component system nitrate/nitrite response regulator NarL
LIVPGSFMALSCSETSANIAPARSRQQRVRVLIADDHPMFHRGVAQALSEYPEFELVSQVERADEALNEIRRLKPDVALVDLRLPDLDGIAIVEQLEREGLPTRVAIVSAYDDSATVYRAIAAGARAYLSKVCSEDVLRATIMAISRGETVIPAALHSGLAREIRARRESDDAVLSARELEVLRLTADGLSAPEIAELLVLGVTTVKTHLQHIYAKLEVSDRAAAVAQAMRRGLLN